MKKCFILSAVLTLCLVISHLVGIWSFNYVESQTLNKANEAFEQGDYEAALLGYGELMDNEKVMNEATYNTALAAYKAGNYENALTSLDKLNEGNYMLRGNCHFKIADTIETDVSEQIKRLEEAVELYKSGIIQDANDLNIKINYELALQKLEDLKQQQEENQQQNEDQQGQDQQDGNQSKEDQNGDNQQEDNQQQDSGENQQGEENKGKEQQESANAEENQGNQSQETGTPDEEIINQVLKMLEEQEAESLKNNQAYRHAGEEETNDW